MVVAHGMRRESIMSCDYNGWNDAPEEEREWFDQHPEIWEGSPTESRPRIARKRAPARPTRSGMAL